MQTFKEWISENHPDFVVEGWLQKLHPMEKGVVGGANTWSNVGGILARMYAPFVGLGGPALPEEKPYAPPAPTAAIVRSINDFDKPSVKKDRSVSLTGIPSIDHLGSRLGNPNKIHFTNAEDWVPANRLNKMHRDREADSPDFQNVPVAMGPLDPTPKHSKSVTVPSHPRMTPRMRAMARADARRKLQQ